MKVGTGNQATQFHFWEYINWIFGTGLTSNANLDCIIEDNWSWGYLLLISDLND
jgi:hypothetical protein